MSGLPSEMQTDETYVGCWQCDSLLQSLVSDQEVKPHKTHRGGWRGTGKRRGRGRRGRGH